MIRRTSGGKAKNGITWSHWRRHNGAIAAYFRPQGPASKASSANRTASARGLVDRLQGCHDLLAVLPRDVGQRVAQQMDDARLHQGLREGSVDRLGEALQPVDHRDQDVLHPAVAKLVDNRKSV